MKNDPKNEKEPKKLPPSPKEEDDDRLDINKSVFEVGRELRRQREEEERLAEEAAAARRAAKEKARREAYDRRILEEKKELMKLKQGVVEESETFREEPEEEIKLSFGKKISNFFYHNKWWLALVLIFGSIGGVLVHNLISKPRPDIVVLVICDNAELGDYSRLKEYVERFVDDNNGNGKKLASVYYIQLSDDDYRNYAVGTDNKLSTELQSAEAVVVIGGRNLYNMYKDDETGSTEDTFVDLGELFPGNPHINNGFFFLNGTPFAERVGIDEKYITDDLFIAVRKPRDLLYCKKKDMEETYEKDIPTLEKIIEDLSSED